ncbi:MAG: DNA primase [Candidatus Omnitrophica bacterium]|nr:DNA primase [Candidatus Omnitrophota bacterium]
MARIPENILDDILGRVNIVEVISGFIPLKRAGRNFKAVCPFHHEKTPSFMVSPDRQIYHCFGCGESGNAFKFLTRYERIDFPEAVEVLAKKAGVVLPKVNTQDSGASSMTTQLYKINEAAAVFYAMNLNSPLGKVPLQYLLERNLKKETVKLFMLGYAQDKWDGLIDFLRMKNFNLSLIEKAGLALTKSSGGYYDRFRNRVLFPILDIKSRALGFGARVLDKTLPKYINSPETPIYTKGRNLYGLNLTKDSIRDEDCVVVVEGYLDLIMPYQEGLRNIVASLGTALTVEQVRLLKRYTHNVVMVYDGDNAGELATLRALDIFIEEGMNVKVVSLPKGSDPDSIVEKEGIGRLKEMVSGAYNLLDYKMKILKSRYDSKNIEDKAKIASAMLESINKFKNAVLKSEYIKKLSGELDTEESALLEEARKIKPEKTYTSFNTAVQKRALNIKPTEKLLIKLMLEENELIETIKQSLQPSDFHDERTAKIVSTMFELVEQGKQIEPNFLINHCSDEDVSQILCESMFLPDVSEQDHEKIINDCILRLKGDKLKSKKERLGAQIKTAQDSGDENTLRALIEEFNCLVKKK